MDICKNALEYDRELSRLLSNRDREVLQKEVIIEEKYREPLDRLDGIEWGAVQREYEKEISDLYHECMKPIEDFIKNQPEQPIYVFKTAGKYYELKKDWIKAEWTKSKNPITGKRLLLLKRQRPGWIIENEFPNSAFDFVECPNCKRKFTRHKSHEKYCHLCRRSPRSKRPLIQANVRYCQNPGCEKPIPAGKNQRAKYCCNACKTAAWEKRKL